MRYKPDPEEDDYNSEPASVSCLALFSRFLCLSSLTMVGWAGNYSYGQVIRGPQRTSLQTCTDGARVV
jgi:hypothetical protein